MTLYPLVMAGGSGTRFWPLSRKTRPKQFLPLASERPLVVDTLTRVKGLALPRNTFVVCGPGHVKAVKASVRALPRANIIVEPLARNTAPAIALGALHVAHREARGVVVALPSDHFVSDPEGFRRDLAAAARLAEQGLIVTLGIKPTRPETGYGYIEVGAALAKGGEGDDGEGGGEGEGGDGGSVNRNGSGNAGYRAAAFVEKPDAARAASYLASGKYLWNGGIFVFRADVMLEAFERHVPEMTKGLRAIGEVVGTRRYTQMLRRHFARFPSISIDYAVAEKADNIAVVPGDFGWSDVGSFTSLGEVREADARGNVVSGRGAVVVDCDRCVVLAQDRPVSVVGMRDVVVVDAGDALLVVPKDKSQDVRKVVDALKARRWERYL